MTRADALRDLLAAVEAGTIKPYSIFKEAHIPSLWAVLPRTERMKASEAFTGSVDAAIAFTEAVLPGWTWELGPCGADLWPLEEYGNPPRASSSIAPERNPARALLIAALKALVAQEEA